MMYDYWGHGSGTDGWGFVFMLLMMVLVILGIVVLVRYLGQEPGSHNQDEALDVLKKRFANGEIDKKEFEEKRKILKG